MMPRVPSIRAGARHGPCIGCDLCGLMSSSKSVRKHPAIGRRLNYCETNHPHGHLGLFSFMSLKHTTIYFLRFNGRVDHLSKSIINLIYFSITSQYRKCIEIGVHFKKSVFAKSELLLSYILLICEIFFVPLHL